jgi:hypothetical protein
VNNDPVNWVDLWGLECSPSDREKINMLGDLTTYKPSSNVTPETKISGNPNANFVGDSPKTGSEYESVVKYFASNDTGANVIVQTREYTLINPSMQTFDPGNNIDPPIQRVDPSKMQMTNMQGTQFTIVENDTGSIVGQFHDANNDNWFDFVELK